MPRLLSAALIGLALTAPFAVLELLLAPVDYSNLPYALFVLLWILAGAFTFVAAPLARAVVARSNVLARPAPFALRFAFLAFATALWVGIVQDQMPCFLGVPHCD